MNAKTYPTPDSKNVPLTFKATRHEVEAIRTEAERRGTSVSQVLHSKLFGQAV